ncbi:MAG: L-threonylcarbamoyladenylate synthase [Acidimicrobiia bacterium]
MTVTPDELARAAAALRAGALVAFPTETVYGLGADASSPDALRRLYAVKGRPADHPVIVHLPSVEAVAKWAVDVSEVALRLAVACWPGPLTLVLRRGPGVLDAVTGGQDTVALRVPDQPVALQLLREFDGAIAAPSANRFGRVSPTTAEDVRAELGDDVAVVLDGGPSRVGVESTIVDCTRAPLRVLRLGGITREHLESIVGEGVETIADAADDVRAPGTLASHYAPRARVRVVHGTGVITTVEEELAAGNRVGVILADNGSVSRSLQVSILGEPCGAAEYAHDLYRMLRAADEQHLDVVVAIAPFDDGGLSSAVIDRLERAAAPRPAVDGT